MTSKKKFTPPDGFTDSIPGHAIISAETIPHEYTWRASRGETQAELTCVCGWSHKTDLRKDGTAGARSRKRWQGHLTSKAETGLVIDVVKISKKRVSSLLQVMTDAEAQRQHVEASRWGWSDDHPWCHVETKMDSKGVVTTAKCTGQYLLKDDAMFVAEAEGRKAETEGFTVEWLQSSTITETYTDAAARLIEVADRALDSESLHDIEAARKEFDDFFKKLPLIQGKYDAVERLRSNLLLGQAS